MTRIPIAWSHSRKGKRVRYVCSPGIFLLFLFIHNSMAVTGSADTLDDSLTACILNEKLGHEIDPRERDVFYLFPEVDGFLRARSYVKPDSTVLIRIEKQNFGTVTDTAYILTRTMADEVRSFIEYFDTIVRGDMQPRFYLLTGCVDVRAIARLARESRVGCLDSYVSVPDRKRWVSASIGRSSAGVLLSVGYVSSLSRKTCITFHFIHAEHSDIFKTPARSIWDLGVLFGIGMIDEKCRILASAGIGLVGGIERGECIENGFLWSKYESIGFSTIGIPMEFQCFLKVSKSGGLGFNLYANINNQRSFCGGALTLVGIG